MMVNEDDDNIPNDFDSLLGIYLFSPFISCTPCVCINFGMNESVFVVLLCGWFGFLLNGLVEKVKSAKVKTEGRRCSLCKVSTRDNDSADKKVYTLFYVNFIIWFSLREKLGDFVKLYGWVYRLYCRFNENRHYCGLTQLYRIEWWRRINVVNLDWLVTDL